MEMKKTYCRPDIVVVRPATLCGVVDGYDEAWAGFSSRTYGAEMAEGKQAFYLDDEDEELATDDRKFLWDE